MNLYLKENFAQVQNCLADKQNSAPYLVQPFCVTGDTSNSQPSHKVIKINEIVDEPHDPSTDAFSIVTKKASNIVGDKTKIAINRMKENFNALLDRGNQIDSLLDKSENFTQTTEEFNSQSKALENQMRLRSCLLPLVALCIILLLMIAISFLNRFIFWVLLIFIFFGLMSIIYFHLHKNWRQLNNSMSSDVSMTVI